MEWPLFDVDQFEMGLPLRRRAKRDAPRPHEMKMTLTVPDYFRGLKAWRWAAWSGVF